MNRCHECDAPLPINGTNCPRCEAPRTDIEQQNDQRGHQGPFVKFLMGVVGMFFSLTMLLWFAGCAVVGVAGGCAMHYGLGVHPIICWIAGILLTFFAYTLSWVMVIWGD